MKPGPFVSLVALLGRLDEKTLAVHARALRDAGILEKGGRGRSGLEVDHVYLAKLLISRMGTASPARAVETYQRFAAMQMPHDAGHWLIQSRLPNPDHTLLDLITLLCDPAAPLSPKTPFEVTFIGSAMVEVKIGKETLTYIDRNELEKGAAEFVAAEGSDDELAKLRVQAFLSPMSMHGIVESRTFNSQWLQMLKDLLFVHEEPPKPA
ncbi:MULTISPECIES: hypothetical protein [unclassified Haematobacter]|uniref:hypothetical protein n=1 Tax=unclassified Haematobacter TaxID=2640585 RepID=UPI0025B8AA76|nr:MULTISPECIES: hypothetical protein [unclassified Haematobacter]